MARPISSAALAPRFSNYSRAIEVPAGSRLLVPLSGGIHTINAVFTPFTIKFKGIAQSVVLLEALNSNTASDATGAIK